jgi:hypothetical protein
MEKGTHLSKKKHVEEFALTSIEIKYLRKTRKEERSIKMLN